MRVALAVTRRPEYADAQLATARRLADKVIFLTHGFTHPEALGRFESYIEMMNVGLSMAEDYAEYVMRIDDHDSYPDGHDPASVGKDGAVVWGIVTQEDCEGKPFGQTTCTCGGALPTVLRLDPTIEKTEPQLKRLSSILYPSGVVKRFCANEWSWTDPPVNGYCRHSKVVA